MTPNDKRRLDRPVEPSHGPNPRRPEGAVHSEAETVERWLQRGRAAIPQCERDTTRAEWLFRKMEAFARLHGDRLAVIRLAEVLSHLESLTRRGHKEWQVLQSLDAICILLSFGCDRQNVRMSEVREHWLRYRASLVGDGYGTPGVSARIQSEVGTASEMRTAEGFPIPVAFTAGTILDRLSRRMRLLHYSRRTEESYAGWWRRLAEFARPTDELQLGPDEARRFLEYLAVERHVSASTQNQALNALVFVFKEILARPLGELEMTRAQRTKRLPVVLTREEVARVLGELSHTYALRRAAGIVVPRIEA